MISLTLERIKRGIIFKITEEGYRDIALHSIGTFDLVADEVKVDGSGDLSERMIVANAFV